ncbi:MAG TPA: TIGR04211 family SH3 domain-containing protein, partial [Gammaproteobacteria bacterium]|nr:TIGR04211 family SH3 domain-containing protein [Gammaproteobacteria bacterium]
DQLASARNELDRSRVRIQELESRVAELTEQLSSVSQRMEEAETAATTLNAELVDVRGASANVLTIRDQNESLRRRLNEQSQLVDALRMDNAGLASRATREWFLLGAGVLVAGIVLGLVIPSLRKKRRTDW